LKIEEIPVPEKVKEILLKSGYSTLYPPQEDAVKAGVLEGKNIVLASPTASGKTLVAEMCILKNILERGGKALYLTPLRALANEKYEEFKKYSEIEKKCGEKIRVAISTGDYDSADPWLAKADIIVTTNEKCDSLLRHKAHWIGEVSVVVADEIHLLTEHERGPTLEVVLTRLMQLNPKTQFLALSATIKNAEEVAQWVKAIPITTDWRPVPLKEGVYLRGEIQFKDGSAKIVPESTGNAILDIALDVVRTGGQVLIFTETRKAAVDVGRKAASALKRTISKPEQRALRSIAEKILSTGERTRLSEALAEQILYGSAFHHAGLSPSHRQAIEDAFREGRIKILAATPTLAAGVNLPARAVVVSSYERYEPGYGRYPISVLEYKQLSGRAGRPKYDKFGEAILVARTPDEQDHLMENYVLAEPERLWSKLAVERVLRPHVLATIAVGFAHTEKGLYDFFSKTFYALQYGSKAIGSRIGDIIRFLCKEDMVKIDRGRLYATEFGKRVSELYIDPVSAVTIRDGLYNRAKRLTELSFLHLICHTPDIAPKLYPRRGEAEKLGVLAEEHADEFMFEIPDMWADAVAYEEFLAELKCAKVLQEWINETTEDSILETYKVEPGDLLRLVEVAEWLFYATHELAKLFGHKDLLARLLELRLRVKNGVKPELVPLVQLKEVGRVRARMLYNAGFKTIEDLRRASVTDLMEVPSIGAILAKKIKEQVGGKIKAEEWEMLKRKKTGARKQRLLTEY
jgi:helicase